MVSASLFHTTWKLEKLTQAFSADVKSEEAQAESVAAETSGPAFIKPRWVCVVRKGPSQLIGLEPQKRDE